MLIEVLVHRRGDFPISAFSQHLCKYMVRIYISAKALVDSGSLPKVRQVRQARQGTAELIPHHRGVTLPRPVLGCCATGQHCGHPQHD